MPPIDPTMLALLSIFGGVLLTIVAGGIGALIQHRREHTKWLRDNRLRVYSEHLAATDNFLRAAQKGDLSEENAVAADAIRALSAVQLVGPEPVFDAAVAFQEAMHQTVKAYYAAADGSEASKQDLDRAEDRRMEARRTFLALAQKEVRVG